VKTKNLTAAGAALAISLLSAASASAVEVYTYTGNTFGYVTNDGVPYGTGHLAGSFTTALPIPNSFTGIVNPVDFHFEFKDSLDIPAITPLQQGDLFSSSFKISTDSSGHIINWTISLLNSKQILGPIYSIFQINTQYEASGAVDFGVHLVCLNIFQDCRSVESQSLFGNPGSWTNSSAPVPEPHVWINFLLGFGLLGAALRRTRRQALPALELA